jgi:putative endopeptidase
MTTKLGHPDAWRDYAGLEIRRDDLIGNVARGSRFEFRRNIAKLGEPVDRSEWPVPPQNGTVYNDLSRNEIVATAAILQPPFFDFHADPAVNYGEIGAMIGHELSRGFDDHGRRFDAAGKLRDWWTAKDLETYAAEANKLAAQFSAYEPLPGQRINGRRTLAENMADLAGLAIAYRAYKIALSNKAAPVRDGLTGDQRFFLAYAQSLAGKRRDDSLREQLASSTQSPERYRVNGIVRNFDPWYAAFAVQPSDKLYLRPEERVRLWAGPAM